MSAQTDRVLFEKFQNALASPSQRCRALIEQLVEAYANDISADNSAEAVLEHMLTGMVGAAQVGDQVLSWTPTDAPLTVGLFAYDNGLPGITTLTVSSTETAEGYDFESTGLESLAFPSLVSLASGSYIYLSDNAALATLGFPMLETTSDFTIYNCDALTALSFPELATASASFRIYNCDTLASLALPKLATVGGEINFNGNPLLTAISAPYLTSTHGPINAAGGMTSIAFASLATTTPSGGSNGLDFTGCADLASVSISLLATTDYIRMSGLANLTAFYAPSLTAAGLVELQSCPSLASLNLHGLTSINRLKAYSCPDLTSVDLTSLPSAALIDLHDCAALTALSLPALTALNTDSMSGSGINLQGATLLATFSAPNLATDNSLDGINLRDCTSLTTFSLPSLSAAGEILVDGDTALASFSCASLTAGPLGIENCTSLTTVSLPIWTGPSVRFTGCTSLVNLALPSFTGAHIYADGCALSAASVNGLLAQCVASGTFTGSNCSIDVSGGDNAAPTGQGITDAATLTDRGCIVATK